MPSPLLVPTRPRLIKPSGDLLLDRTHPLAYGLLSFFLLNEGSGKTVRDLAKPSRTSTLATNATWAQTPWGPAVVPGSSGTDKNTFSDTPTTSGASFTTEIMLKHTGSDAGFAVLISGVAGTWGVVIDANHIDLDATSDPTGTLTMATGSFYHCVVTWNGTTATYFTNGLTDGSGANSGVPNPAVFNQWGGDGATFPANNNTIIWFRIWDRVLNRAEAASLYTDPFGMVRSPSEEARSFSIVGSRPLAAASPVATLLRTLAPPTVPPSAPVHLFSPPSGGGQITAQAGVGIGVAPNALVSSTYQVAATAGVGIGVNAATAAIQSTYSIQAQPGVGIGVAQNALVKTNYQIAPVAGVGIGVAQNALVSTSYQIAPAAGLGIGVAQNALVSSTYTIAAAAGVGIGVMFNATLSGNQNQIVAQAGVGIGVVKNILVQQTYSIAAQANTGYGIAQDALVQQQYRIAALAGLAIGVMANATLQSGLGANNPPPSATVAASSPTASATLVQPNAIQSSNNPGASVQTGTPGASVANNNPTGRQN